MRSTIRLVLIATLVAALAACSSPAASGTPPTTPSPSTALPSDGGSQPSEPAPTGQGSPAATAEPIPSDELDPFSCDLPMHVDATTGRALLTDVRIGEHDGYDRVVFEFRDGLPEASLERAEPPFTQDASGLPIEVEGDSFLRLIMRGGTKQQEDGTSSYDGSTDFEVDGTALVHLVEGGDFEAQSTWYLGLNAESCVRLFTLEDDGTARLVIDIEH